MEKLKEYVKERFATNAKMMKYSKKIFKDDSEKELNFYFGLSKHKIENLITILNVILKIKFPKRGERLRGTESSALPDAYYKDLINYVRKNYGEKIALALEYEGIEGPRGEDVVELKENNIDFVEHKVTIFNTKCKRFYTIPLNQGFEKELKLFVEQNHKEIDTHNGFVFFSKNPRQIRDHISEKWLKNVVVDSLNSLGLEKEYAISSNGRHLNKFVLHSLRAHAATVLFEKTHDLRMVQRLLDHMPGSADVTMLYIGGIDNEFAKAMRE